MDFLGLLLVFKQWMPAAITYDSKSLGSANYNISFPNCACHVNIMDSTTIREYMAYQTCISKTKSYVTIATYSYYTNAFIASGEIDAMDIFAIGF